jgi:ATP-dependent Clp protease ATP-binding subunit ClpA
VYLPADLADAVRDAQVPVSAICQAALERVVRDVTSARSVDVPPAFDHPGVGLFSRFTPRAQQAVINAERTAREVPHDYVGTEHVLLGLIDEGGNLGLTVLDALEIEADDLRVELVASIPPPTKRVDGHLRFTALTKRALEATAKEALSCGHNYIGCEHILLGLLATDEGIASQVLRRMGLDLRATRRAVITALSGFAHAQQSRPPSNATTTVLEQILQRLDAIEGRLNG